MEGDIPEEVVDQFCKLHPISEDKKKRLLNVIKQQIKEYYLEVSPKKEEDSSAIFDESAPLTQIDEGQEQSSAGSNS